MSARALLPKTITIPAHSVLTQAQHSVGRDEKYYQIEIPIGPDHVAFFLIGEKDLSALNLINPEPHIS